MTEVMNMLKFSSLVLLLLWSNLTFAVDSCQTTNGAITDSNANCYAEPQEYYTTIYKLGLCTSRPTAPTSNTAVDLSSCTTVFENTSGTKVKIVKGMPTKLTGTVTRPPNGSYPYAIALLAPEFELKTSLTFLQSRSNYPSSGVPATSGTVCWSRTGTFYSNRSVRARDLVDCGSAVGSNNGLIKSVANAMDVDGSGNSIMTKDFGSVIGYLLTSTNTLASSSPGSIGTIDKILGLVPAPSPIVVTSSSTKLDISFSISRGATVEMDSLGMAIEAFGVGPFLPVISVD
jgi:hypothetical protein